MQSPYLITTEDRQDLPVAILDNSGLIGSHLAQVTSRYFLTVVITGAEKYAKNNIIYLPFRKLVSLPDNHFSHIFICFNGEKEILKMLPDLLKRAKETQTKIIFVTSIYDASEKVIEHLQRQYIHVQIALYGDLISSDRNVLSPANTMLHEAYSDGEVTLFNAGLHTTYPVTVDDVVSGIIHAAFAHGRSQPIFFMLPEFGVTDLSLARILKNILPKLKIDVKEVDFRVLHRGEPEARNKDPEEDEAPSHNCAVPLLRGQGERVLDIVVRVERVVVRVST